MWARQSARPSVWPFQYTVPCASTASWMLSGLVRLGWLDALGRSILTECVRRGAVMMKITSRTSITSISGIMLISAIGALSAPRLKPPKAISGALVGGRQRGLHGHYGAALAHVRAGDEHRVEVVRERVELRKHQ